MNVCFLSGKINSEIHFDFISNSKKHISIASCLILLKESEIRIFAFDSVADILFSNYELGKYIIVEGTITGNSIEVIRIYEC